MYAAGWSSALDAEAPWSWGGLRQRVGKGNGARSKGAPVAGPPVAAAVGGDSSPGAVRGASGAASSAAGGKSRSGPPSAPGAAEPKGACGKFYGGGMLPPGFVFENGCLRVLEPDERVAHSAASVDSGKGGQGNGDCASRTNGHRRIVSSDFQDALDAVAGEVRRSSVATIGGGQHASPLTPSSSCVDQEEALSHHSLRWREEQGPQGEPQGELSAHARLSASTHAAASAAANVKAASSENSIERMFVRIKNRHHPIFSQGSGDADVPARTGAVTGAEGADSPQVGQIKDAEAPHECNGAARPQLLRPFGGGSGRSDSEEAQRIEGLFQSLVGAGANGT